MNVLELDSGTTRENMKVGEGEGLERAKKTFKKCNVAPEIPNGLLMRLLSEFTYFEIVQQQRPTEIEQNSFAIIER